MNSMCKGSVVRKNLVFAGSFVGCGVGGVYRGVRGDGEVGCS